MMLMEPAQRVMEVAPLPALNREFTTYRLDICEPRQRASFEQPACARAS